MGDWLKNPSSWLSVIAAVISVATFVLVHADPGDIKVVLPDNVGVKHVDGELLLLVPVTLTNTGAPRTVRHISSMTAHLNEDRKDRGNANTVALRWRTIFTLLGRAEYALKYRIEDKSSLKDQDFLDYDSRANPFALYGGNSTQKTVEFRSRKGAFPGKTIASFTLTVVGATNDGREFPSIATYYHCENIVLGGESFQYCDKHRW